MKITQKHQTFERKNSDVCIVTEYPIEDQDIDIARVQITSRYPAEGWAINRKCKEIVYVQEGSGKVVVGDQEYPLVAEDVVLIEAGERFYWDGSLSLLISCTPAFTVDQHHVIQGE